MISSLFELLSLPSVTSSNDDGLVFSGKDNICLGVSHSSINVISLRPPQVFGAHSVPPNTIITAVMEGYESINCYATKERSKYFVRLVSGAHREVPYEVSALYSNDAKDIIVAVYRNATISAYNPADLSDLWSEKGQTGENGYNWVFSALIDSATFTMISRSSKDPGNLRGRTLSFDRNSVQTLITSSIDGIQDQLSSGYSLAMSIEYSTLYLSSHSLSRIYLYSLPDLSLKTSFDLTEKPKRILPMPNNNILVSYDGNTVAQIDCTFESEVSRQTFDSDVSLLTYSESASSALAVVGRSQVMGFNVTPTSGTLLESLNRGIQLSQDSGPWSYGLNSVFEPSAKEFQKTASRLVSAAIAENKAIIEGLEKNISDRNGSEFSRVVTYLKTPQLTWEESTAPEVDDLMYEESDKESDACLIRSICRLCFGLESSRSKSSSRRVRHLSFIPEVVYTYLLTHPLFPTSEIEFSNGTLLKVLTSRPRLYRQAIVTLAGIDPRDLVLSLLNPSDDIFNDTVTRLVDEFGHQHILDAIRDTFSELRSLSALQPLVERLARHERGWQVISPMVDAIGLLGWQSPVLKRLQARLQDEILMAEEMSAARVVLDDVLASADMEVTSAANTSSGVEVRKQKHRVHKNALANGGIKTIPRYSIESLYFE